MTSRIYAHGPSREGNETRFRLWAPSASTVELLIEEQEARPMARGVNGEFSVTASAAEGTRYRFRIDGDQGVPDPASRYQPEDTQGLSEVVFGDYRWEHVDWKGRPWHEAVIMEVHVGTFSPEGNYAGIEKRLDHLASLGITAIQLMPIAEFAGTRNWGYDGVLPYAPERSYGRPEELKRLIDAAHGKGLMVFLDVVYNHFGPDGNYLPLYAKSFFTEKYHTPWGGAVNVEGERKVRDFFLENALYWLEEFRFDGLRFDAVHAIEDASEKHFLDELSETIRHEVGSKRHVHLILENEENSATLLARDGDNPIHFTAQWNDDFHHECHVLLTGEKDAYYANYQGDTLGRLLRVLTQGFDYQGEGGVAGEKKPRGEKSGHLPPGAFVNFLHNHDQVGNRAMGERLSSLAKPEAFAAFQALLLLAPFPPMLFMGEEWGETNPFLFFCDFHDELADAVREGRRKEFAHFPQFADPEQRKKIPDPNAVSTFEASKLNWDGIDSEKLEVTKRLLSIRREKLFPLFASGWQRNEGEIIDGKALKVIWHFAGGSLEMNLNLSDSTISAPEASGNVIYGKTENNELKSWAGLWRIRNKE